MGSVDIAAVRKRFIKANMPGAIKLLDFLLTKEGRTCVVVGGKYADANMSHAEILLGATKENPRATPLGDLAMLSEMLQKFTEGEISTIDEALKHIASSEARDVSGKVSFESRMMH